MAIAVRKFEDATDEVFASRRKSHFPNSYGKGIRPCPLTLATDLLIHQKTSPIPHKTMPFYRRLLEPLRLLGISPACRVVPDV